MDAIVEIVLEAFIETALLQEGQMQVAITQEGSVEPAITLTGHYGVYEDLPGEVPSPFEVIESLWLASLPMNIAASPDEYFTAYTDARTGLLAYLLYEEGDRVTLEDSGYVIL